MADNHDLCLSDEPSVSGAIVARFAFAAVRQSERHLKEMPSAFVNYL